MAPHARTTPGSPRLEDAHFPPAPAGALQRQPKPRTQPERDFLALGDGATLWLTEAAAAAGRPDALLRRLRLPHIRRQARQVIATATAQRWEPAEVLPALLGYGQPGHQLRGGTGQHRSKAGRKEINRPRPA